MNDAPAIFFGKVDGREVVFVEPGKLDSHGTYSAEMPDGRWLVVSLLDTEAEAKRFVLGFCTGALHGFTRDPPGDKRMRRSRIPRRRS